MSLLGPAGPGTTRRACFVCTAALTLLAAAGCQREHPSRSAGAARPGAPIAPATGSPVTPAQPPSAAGKRRVIVFVWDGLRPDSIDPAVTPLLARLRDQDGVNFKNHHAIYPTFTMMNAAAIASATTSGEHGFYGNSEYLPGLSGHNSKGAEVDYTQPFFSEDHAILQTLDAHFRAAGSALLRTQNLFEAAHAAGLQTAALGKAGPTFLQDYRQSGRSGVILDENVALPRAFALQLQAAGMPLPKNTALQRYPEGPLQLAADNGDPTAPSAPVVTLADGVTPDPRAAGGSPHKQRNAYLMRVFIDYVLPQVDPSLSLIWLRNPDSTEHAYGPGTPNVLDALRHQDQLLGQLLAALARLGRRESTDLLITSDHGHSSVGSSPRLFPLRALGGAADGHGEAGEIAQPGYVVSGDIRSAEWLLRAGFAHVYDGSGCIFDPVLGGIDRRGRRIHESHDDPECGGLGRASTPSHRVPPGPLARDAIIIAANGGSEYYYVPSHDRALVQRLVVALQERAPYGALFLRSAYGPVAGTMPLARIGLEGPDSISPPTPDLVASFDWDEGALSAAASMPGSEHSNPQNYRGMHGSFSARDVHNTLIAVGPDFRAGFADDYPSSSLDLAPTVAVLLGLSLPHASGRVLTEALADSTSRIRYDVHAFVEEAGPVALHRVCALDDPACKRPGKPAQYRFKLYGQTLTAAGSERRYEYLDRAPATRER
jgi:arylsulfatase A-like enzyme